MDKKVDEECPMPMGSFEEHNPLTREFCNNQTRRLQTDNRIVYFFKYTKDNGEEAITWQKLSYLKYGNHWEIIRHPFVMNFVNEVLLRRALFYSLYVAAFIAFLILLSSYIFEKTLLQDLIATAFLIIFFFFMVVKFMLRTKRKITIWFAASYAFNLITYIVTFLFIWTPMIFAFDDYNTELKLFISWFLPIIAIISAWINFLYILRKSPYGIYILMLSRILHSFLQIAIIWIPTLLAFSFAFHLVMRDSGQEPWEATDALSSNSTISQKILMILQAVTKTSAMMIGEVDADNVIVRKEWIPNLLLLAFEVTTVILLMNLMISLAVGDVNELRQSAEQKLLEIKVSFAIEMLQLSESCECLSQYQLLQNSSTPTMNNILIINANGDVFSVHRQISFGFLLCFVNIKFK